MESNQLDVSVVICTYVEDRWDELVTAVGSVQRQTVPPGEIIVVVDHNLGLLERVRQELPAVTAVENTQIRGLGGARNSGLAVARGNVVAFLDDDATAVPDWLAQMVTAYGDPNVLGVGGSAELLSPEDRPAWFPAEFDWVVGCSYRGMPESTSAVRNLFGCNMSFRRRVFDAIGDFRLGYGCDETEFCIRALHEWPQGLLIYKPEARVLHHVARSRMSWPYFVSRCYFEGGSKAVVTWLAGSKIGLASERAYTFRTLPRGFSRGLADAMLRRDRSGLARAGAICAGLAVTTAGYLVGRVSTVKQAHRRGWSDQTERAAR